MSPILGIWGSKYTAPAPNYYSIQTATVTSGGNGAITFSSIPQTYTHLQVRAITRSDSSNVYNAWWRFTINGITTTTYSEHDLNGNGSTASASSGTGQTDISGFYSPGSDAGANMFGAQLIDILDYTNTNKYKTVRYLSGTDINFSTTRLGIDFGSGANYTNTNAITSITFTPVYNNWVQYTQFALYGVK